MPGDRFEFDEHGDTFFCFLVAFYTLVLIPVTYFCWPTLDSRDTYEQGKRKCMCQPCQVKRHNLKTSTPMKKLKKFLIKGGFVLAWIVFFVMIYKLTLMETVESGFDPFVQLEIDRDASPSEIRRAYKRLSLKFHPDKGGDPKRFILISKAYAALTNEESRKNWEEYGNPDGPGAAHFGIALPKWMIQKENFYVVIGAYVLLFMLILPIGVGTWWYNTMKFSNNHVLLDTIRYLCGTFMRSPYMAMPRVIKVLSNAYEFNPSFNKEIVCRPSDNVELPPLIMKIPIFTIFRKAIVGSPSSVKARALIYAHLDRIPLSSKTLHLDQQYIIKNCPRLIDEMINSLLYVLAVAMDEAGSRHKTPQHLATIENCMHLVPMLIQSLSDNASPLLQLPHIGSSQLRHMVAKQRNIKSIRQLVKIPDEKRRTLLRSLSDEQYRDVLNVCASMPSLEVTYRCEVLDDEDPSIWPLSMVTATITLKRHPLFEPTTAASSTSAVSDPGSGATTMPDLHYSGSGRYDWWAYDQSPNSQLYQAADPNIDAGPMGYGDFGEEDNDQLSSDLHKPKKTTTPVWDKGKRKKPARKGKQRGKQDHLRQQQQHQQHKLRMDQSSAATLLAPTGDLDSDEGGPETVSKCENSREKSATKKQKPDDTETLAAEDPANEGSGGEDTQDVYNNDEADSADEKTDADMSKLPRTSVKSSSSRSKFQESKPHCTHVVHCPYFPVEKFEGWWIYLVDRKTRQLITKPVYISTLQTEEEIPLRFMAPSLPGSYFYTLCVRSDSYIDCDVSETVRFTVSPLPESVLNYLKVQEEAHSDDSSASSCVSSDEEGDEGSEVDQQDDSSVPNNEVEDDYEEEEEEVDAEIEETQGRPNGSVTRDRVSAYLAKA
ncbi:Translocation protein SEC63 [Paragonimus heterotremus]|uniref:Translocation protein SEC63 n=1 Tax=Paragonimus heterotremus TaxID=100268 RepID=A0A8J4WHJ2_9TREM|nr:Translocation protein SEC63 [Paragonimus heterotremus]